jgi:hypothetical protein
LYTGWYLQQSICQGGRHQEAPKMLSQDCQTALLNSFETFRLSVAPLELQMGTLNDLYAKI